MKFQMLEADKLLGDHRIEYSYPTMSKGPRTEKMLEIFKRLEQKDEEQASLKRCADECDLQTIVTSH